MSRTSWWVLFEAVLRLLFVGMVAGAVIGAFAGAAVSVFRLIVNGSP